MSNFDPDAFLGITEPEQKKKRQDFDPDAFLAGPKPAPKETAVQTFGRSAASTADSVLNTLTGTLDIPARAMARAYYGGVRGMPLAQAEQRAVAETTSPKDVFGRAFGVTNTAGYQQAPLRQLGTAIGETVGENIIQPVAKATGLPESYVGDVTSMLPIPAAQPAGRAVAATGRAARAVAQVPVDVARGAAGRATGYIARPGETPTGYQVPSSRIPLGETFIPAAEMANLKQGMPMSPGAVRPISELAPGPVLALSGGEIPVAGQAARAFGERIGETYSNPYTAAADIGSAFLTGGIPILTAGRGALGLAQGAADAYLGRKGFTSLSPEQQTILNSGGNPFFATGSVAPAQAAQSMAQSRIAPPTTPAQAAAQQAIGPVEPPPMQAAAPEPVVAPVAAAQETVAQRAQRVMGDNYRAPVADRSAEIQAALAQVRAPKIEQPVAGPVAPVDLPPPPVVAAPVVEAPVNTPKVKTEMKSGYTPSTKKITFDDLLNDIAGIDESAVRDPSTGKIIAQRTFDIENKIITDPAGSPYGLPSSIDKLLPKKYEWEKSVEHWTPDGSDIAFTEYYTKPTKNTPAYKYVEDGPNPGLYKLEGTTWKEVGIPPVADKNGVLDYGKQKYQQAQAIISKNVNDNKSFNIQYKYKGEDFQDYFAPDGFKVKFDPSFNLTRRTANLTKDTLVSYGTNAAGEPVRLNFLKDKSKPLSGWEKAEIYVTRNGKEVLDRIADTAPPAKQAVKEKTPAERAALKKAAEGNKSK